MATNFFFHCSEYANMDVFVENERQDLRMLYLEVTVILDAREMRHKLPVSALVTA